MKAMIFAAGLGSRLKPITDTRPKALVTVGGKTMLEHIILKLKAAGFDEIVINVHHFSNQILAFLEANQNFGVNIQISDETDCLLEAVLCAKSVVDTPYVIINADDYYGKEAFVKLHDFLINHEKMGKEFDMGMAGFILKNTLSENGTVTRGVCKVDDNNLLKEVYETTGIKAEAEKIVCDDPEVEAWVKPESNVSMNMWAGYPDFLDYLEKDFSTFLSNISDNPMKKEYLLPNIVAELLREDRINVKVLETHDKWFGVTYAEDKEYVQNAFKQLIENGVYPEKLWK